MLAARPPPRPFLASLALLSHERLRYFQLWWCKHQLALYWQAFYWAKQDLLTMVDLLIFWLNFLYHKDNIVEMVLNTTYQRKQREGRRHLHFKRLRLIAFVIKVKPV